MSDEGLDPQRFWDTIEASAAIGRGRPGGLTRLALSDHDREMRDLFVRWCREAGLAVSSTASATSSRGAKAATRRCRRS